MRSFMKALNFIGAVLFLAYNAIWSLSKWALKGLDYVPFLMMIAYYLRQLHPYAILAIFAIPLAFSEVVTLMAYAELAKLNLFNFAFLFVASKVLGFMPMVWIYQETKNQLHQIGWFLFLVEKLSYYKSIIFNYIRSTDAWLQLTKTVKAIKLRVRVWIAFLRQRVRKNARESI